MRFESKNANDLWIGDYHDKTQLICLHSGRFAYLSAFIDCHSRYIVHGEYYLKENIMTLEDSFKKAILKWGTPKRIYVDITILYELFMLEDKRIVDRKTCVVSVMGKSFQSESFLAGRKVNVHYNPNDLSYVIIYYKDKYIHKAFPQEINKKLPAPSPDSSYDLKYD